MDLGLWNTYDRPIYDEVHIHTQCLINSNLHRTLNIFIVRSRPIGSIRLIFRLNECAYLVSSACWYVTCDFSEIVPNGNKCNMLRCIYNWIVLTFLNADKKTIRKLFAWFMGKDINIWSIEKRVNIFLMSNHRDDDDNNNKSCSLFSPPRWSQFNHFYY